MWFLVCKRRLLQTLPLTGAGRIHGDGAEKDLARGGRSVGTQCGGLWGVQGPNSQFITHWLCNLRGVASLP